MRIRQNRGGFSLLELIIAMSLSAVVLITVFSIAASMVQFEVEGGRKGSVTAWSLASIANMNRDIASASVIEWPNGAGAADNNLVLCTNWSRLMAPPNGAVLSAAVGPGPTVIYYCWDSATNVLRRMVLGGNCPNVGVGPPACNAANYGAGSVVATAVYQNAGNFLFTVDTSVKNAVRTRYVVGNPAQGQVNSTGGGASGVVFQNPQSMAFDTRIVLEN
ncbi:MAG: prepilin-type N-terminal cleavage/methylation domain-containing protein [Elusimicrobia bacterium]|nr:prepilin-type N-terminal cleavage/methylation domain-containing protein [Elusimicrobiota bacterium]